MELPDRFASTYCPAAHRAGATAAVAGRHMPILRRCVGAHDEAVVVARCTWPAGGAGSNLLLLTRRRLVVTSESAVLRRRRLHLNAALHHLADVTWTPEPALGGVQLSLTAIDGVREHFWLRATDAAHVAEVDAALREAFRPAPTTPLALAA